MKNKDIFARILIGLLLYLFADKVNAPTNYVAKKFRLLKRKINSQYPWVKINIFFERSRPIQFGLEVAHYLPWLSSKKEKITIC
jgi:hypothetical protein